MNFSILRFDLIGSPRGSKAFTSRLGLFPFRVFYSPPSRHR
nr:MAG TPA: hypothetical protein [Caudoviricetes sp.]